MNTKRMLAFGLRKRFRLVTAGLLVLSSPLILSNHPSTATAQAATENAPSPVTDADAKTTPVTSIYEPTTLAVVKIDLASVDPTQIAQWAEKVSGKKSLPPALVMLVDGFVNSLRNASVKDLSITMSTVDLMQGTPAVIARTDNPAIFNGMLAMLWQQAFPDRPATLKSVDGVAIFGSAETVQRLTSDTNRGSERFALLQSHPLLDHQILLSLPEEARRDLATLWPDRMPAASPVQFSPRQMVSDLESVQIGFRLPPQPGVEFSLQAVDEVAAARVETVTKAAIKSASPFLDRVTVESIGPAIRISISSEDLEALISKVIGIAIANQR
jgi:hypothetical protein